MVGTGRESVGTRRDTVGTGRDTGVDTRGWGGTLELWGDAGWDKGTGRGIGGQGGMSSGDT